MSLDSDSQSFNLNNSVNKYRQIAIQTWQENIEKQSR